MSLPKTSLIVQASNAKLHVTQSTERQLNPNNFNGTKCSSQAQKSVLCKVKYHSVMIISWLKVRIYLHRNIFINMLCWNAMAPEKGWLPTLLWLTASHWSVHQKSSFAEHYSGLETWPPNVTQSFRKWCPKGLAPSSIASRIQTARMQTYHWLYDHIDFKPVMINVGGNKGAPTCEDIWWAPVELALLNPKQNLIVRVQKKTHIPAVLLQDTTIPMRNLGHIGKVPARLYTTRMRTMTRFRTLQPTTSILATWSNTTVTLT